MKKIFTLLTLLVCVCTGAWATTVSNIGLTQTYPANTDSDEGTKTWSSLDIDVDFLNLTQQIGSKIYNYNNSTGKGAAYIDGVGCGKGKYCWRTGDPGTSYDDQYIGYNLTIKTGKKLSITSINARALYISTGLTWKVQILSNTDAVLYESLELTMSNTGTSPNVAVTVASLSTADQAKLQNIVGSVKVRLWVKGGKTKYFGIDKLTISGEVEDDTTPTYAITWANGGHGTAPTTPTTASYLTLPTMTADGYTNTGWKANQIVQVGGANVAANTEIATGSIVTLLQATTFTGVWKTNSGFTLTSAAEVEVNIDGNSTITTSGAVAVPTYTSGDESVATVSSTGKITAVAGGKTTITVTDPGNEDVMGKSLTVTVLVPYPNPAAADSYVLNQDTYAFSNTANTKYYFTNGFTMTPNTAVSLDNGGLAKSKKYSHARNYTIKTPSNVTVRYAVITARNNYKNENSNPAATWGTVFGTDYSSEGNLPWSNEDPVEKDFTVPSPFAGKSLEFQPGGNQWQAIINLYTITYHSKYAVSFDKGEGTGSMEGTEVRGGSTYILPASTFTAPANKGFAGWLCDIDGLVYDAGENYTMTDAATTFTAQYAGVEGKMIIRATPTSTSAATVTGTVGGTADVNLQNGGSDGWKFGGDTHHIGITLASGWTFKAGDIINVHITKEQDTGGEIIFYNSDKSVIYDTDDAGVEGDNRYVLSDAFEGKTAIYLYRLTASNNWNAYIDYIEVTRPLSLVSVTIGANGWSTFSNTTKALDFSQVSPAGLKAYMVTGASGTAITKSDAVATIPANTGLLLNGTAGTTYYIPEVASSSTDVSANKMKPGTGAAVNYNDNSSLNYVLVNNGATAEFQKIVSGTYSSAVIPVGKAYLSLTEAPAREILDIDPVITGIENVNRETITNNQYFDLQGRRVLYPTKGLYIVNGKKVILK